MKKIAITLGALVLAGCAAYAQDSGDAASAAIEAEPAAEPAPPPGMPQPVTMAQRPNATGGEKLYVEHCIMCHGPIGMGTGLLGRRMEVSELERRGNLPAAYVIQAARLGIGNMPAIPRGEVSDEDLKAIADYIAAGPHK